MMQMRYFTKEMWAGWQVDSTYDADDFSRRCKTYWRQLRRLRDRVNEQTYLFFTKDTLHDGRIVSLTVLDASGAAMASGTPHAHTKSPSISIHIGATKWGPDGRRAPRVRLEYTEVRQVLIDSPSKEPLFPVPFRGFGDWGYDELTGAGRNFLRHEILFSSGATILIEAKEIVAIRGRRSQMSPRALPLPCTQGRGQG